MLSTLKRLLLVSVSVSTLLLGACHDSNSGNSIKVGTIAGPETELMQTAAKVAKKKYGLTIQIVEFSDYVEPNAALNDGSINANAFQTQPFLDQQIKDRHYKLVSVGKTFVYPIGVYSNKTKHIAQVKPKSLVAIPNDPSNEGRALLLLEKAGLIRLKANVGLFPTIADIKENPHQLKFKELDAAQIPRSLPDVDLAVINTNYAIPAGLTPTKDAIFLEGSDSPYANLIVVRTSDVNEPHIKQLVDAFESAEVIATAKQIFNGQAIPAWDTAKSTS